MSCGCGSNGGSGCACRIDSTDSIDVSGSGLVSDPFLADLIVDPDVTNRLSVNSNGVYVPEAGASIELPAMIATEHGVTGGGVTDDFAAAQAAVNLVKSTYGGGTLLLPPRAMRITGDLKVPRNVNLYGTGRTFGTGAGAAGSVIKTSGSSARVTFGGNHAVDTVGGLSGNFTIYGAGGHVAAGALYIDLQVGRTFQSITVNDCAGTAILVDQSQNCLFEHVEVYDPATDCLVLDWGAGTNRFTRCEFAGAGRYGALIQETHGGTGPLAYPSFNVFDQCLIEYANATTGSTTNNLRIMAGQNNTFRNLILSGVRPTETLSGGFLAHLENCQATFDNCYFSVAPTTAKAVFAKNTSNLILTGRNVINGGAVGINFDTSIANGSISPETLFSGTTARYQLTNGASLAQWRHGLHNAIYLNDVAGVFTLDPHFFDWEICLVDVNSTMANLPAGEHPGQEFTITQQRAAAGVTCGWPSNVFFATTAPTLGATVGNMVSVKVGWIDVWRQKA